jgi:tRNA-dihydrouridine synthase B
MAGITDRPFRRLARRFGAALAVSEMISARPELRGSRKTRLRRDHDGEPGPISVQIAGADPRMLAEAARFNVGEGAEIIDVNMGARRRRCATSTRARHSSQTSRLSGASSTR